jgi:hypothetical protein
MHLGGCSPRHRRRTAWIEVERPQGNSGLERSEPGVFGFLGAEGVEAFAGGEVGTGRAR